MKHAPLTDVPPSGNDYKLQMSQFQGLYDIGKANDNYDLSSVTDYRRIRFQQSIAENPFFFNAPIAGFVAEHAAWSFIPRLMGNHSEEEPSGFLNGDVLKTFYAITGEDGNFTYTEGHERIPDNWYKRNPADQYGYPDIQLDAIYMTYGKQNLEFVDIGGNTGTPGSFVGFDPDNITSNVYSLDNLQQDNNLLCYFFELTVQELPDILLGLFSDITSALNTINPVLDGIIQGLECPKLSSVSRDQFSQFPGYTQSYNGYSPGSPDLLGGL